MTEPEVAPQLPTSGQVLGVLVKSLGIEHPWLRSKTARRYFTGRLDDRVSESSREKTIGAIADVLVDLGLGKTPGSGEDSQPDSSTLAEILDWYAVGWDRLRAFLRPRMTRVEPRHLASVWQTYLRLCAIDLALRVAAHIHLAGASPTALNFLEWTSVDRRAAYLNKRRSEAGLSLECFAELAGVFNSTVEAWVYNGVRPSDKRLVRIAQALGSKGEPSEWQEIARELRRLYGVGQVAATLKEYIGTEAVGQIIGRVGRYASLLYCIIDDKVDSETRAADLTDIGTLGVHSRLSETLLNPLSSHESDVEWKQDITAAGSNWITRVLAVNLKVHQAEVDALIQETDGRILKDWDVSNSEAYRHYLRAMELRIEGRKDEALEEVAKAVKLDPLDPANHFTLGSFKGGIGARNGDEALVKEGMDAVWMAITLDPTWILPWTEIGWLLIQTGRARDAVEHLLAAKPECGPLDFHYYFALGAALRELGEFARSLTAFESAREQNPDDPRIAAAIAATAEMVDDTLKSRHYSKTARHLGASDESIAFLELLREMKSKSPTRNTARDSGREIATLDEAIGRNPDDATLYVARGRAFFMMDEDHRAVSDLDKAIRLDPGNADAYQTRGITYGYMQQFEQAIADLSEAIRLRKGDFLAHYFRGRAYGEQDAFDLAIADLDEAIDLNPAYAPAYQSRGDCHRFKRKYDLAVADYIAALRLDPRDAHSYRGRGEVHMLKGDLDSAIADYDAALQHDPEDAQSYQGRGDCHRIRKEYDLAIADYDVALKFNPEDAHSYMGRGHCHRYKNELDLAIADYDAALKFDPEDAQSYRGRGATFHMRREFERAVADFSSALKLDPKDSFTYKVRADAHLANKNFEEAIADFNIALSSNPDDEAAYRNRGIAQFSLGKLDLAVADLNAAVESDPGSALSSYVRGKIREAMGDTEGARQDYLRAQELGSSDSAGSSGFG